MNSISGRRTAPLSSRRLPVVQRAALVEPSFEPLVFPHESATVCGEAENVSSHRWHNAFSRPVNRRSAGSGSICGRGGGAYGVDGDAQAVIASAHAALSSFQGFSISLFLLNECIVGGALGSPQLALACHGDVGVDRALLLAGGDGGGVASLARARDFGPVPEPAGRNGCQQQDRLQREPV